MGYPNFELKTLKNWKFAQLEVQLLWREQGPLGAVYENYKMTRSSGCCAPFLLAPARGWGALWATNSPSGCFGGFWFLKISKLYFESEFPLLGGLFYKTFLFEASSYMFLIFGNFWGSF